MSRTGAASWSTRSPPRRCGRSPTRKAPSLSRYRRTARCSPPNGVTLAAWDQYELWLIDADGSDRRVIAEEYTHHEWAIGPVWSPDGKRIVFQRSIDDPGHGGDETLMFARDEEVVIVTVGADDPLGPIGTQSVLGPTLTADGGEPVRWLPVVVTWAPSSHNLRFVGLRRHRRGKRPKAGRSSPFPSTRALTPRSSGRRQRASARCGSIPSMTSRAGLADA